MVQTTVHIINEKLDHTDWHYYTRPSTYLDNNWLWTGTTSWSSVYTNFVIEQDIPLKICLGRIWKAMSSQLGREHTGFITRNIVTQLQLIDIHSTPRSCDGHIWAF